MNTTMVIPTYWCRDKETGHKEGDVIYDHPSALGTDGTLGRTLESLKIIANREYSLLILVCPTSLDIEEEALETVKKIVKGANLKVKTFVFSIKDLEKIKVVIKENKVGIMNNLNLSLFGYSNVRNVCLIAANALGSDVALLVDDDELIEKEDFIELATEFIDKHIHGKAVYGVAGYYLNKNNEFYDDVKIVPWMTYWNRFGFKSQAFDKIISSDPRIKKTPFVFGGAMVLHRNLFQTVPFDPLVKRGEDIDYLINAKMLGFEFFLDNLLNVKHMPPEKDHPIWKRFREDMNRFLYEHAKIKSQREVNNMQIVTPEDFDPYPGEFLKDDLEDKIYKTSVLLALEYLSEGDMEGCRESLQNIYDSKNNEFLKINPFEKYRKYQKHWEKVMEKMFNNREEIRKIMEETTVVSKRKSESVIDVEIYKSKGFSGVLKQFSELSIFDESELKKIASIAKKITFEEGDYLFKENEKHNCLYFIITGTVSVTKIEDSVREVELNKLMSGDIIGESILVKKIHTVSAVAKEFCEVITIKEKDLRFIIEDNPILGNKILFAMIEKVYKKLDTSNNSNNGLIDRSYYEDDN